MKCWPIYMHIYSAKLGRSALLWVGYPLQGFDPVPTSWIVCSIVRLPIVVTPISGFTRLAGMPYYKSSSH